MLKGHSRESGRTRGRGNEITLLSAFRAQNVIVIVMVIVLPSLQGEGYGGASVTRDGVGVRLPLTFYIYTESLRFIIKEEITMGVKISRDFIAILSFLPWQKSHFAAKSLEILSPPPTPISPKMCQCCVSGVSPTVTLQPFVYRGCAVVSVFFMFFLCTFI